MSPNGTPVEVSALKLEVQASINSIQTAYQGPNTS